MNSIDAFGYIAIGFFFALLIVMAVISYYAKKGYDDFKKNQPKPMDATVTRRLKEAADMTKEQNEIIAAASLPSANALHSRHKNDLISRHKHLEEQKIEVLTSIVKEGHDPLVTCFNASTNQDEQLPLSKFLEIITGGSTTQKSMEPETPPPPVGPEDSIKTVKKNGKTFYVISAENQPRIINRFDLKPSEMLGE